jgi:Amt family ammonium transporter
VLAALVYSGAVTFVLLKLIDLVLPLRAAVHAEGVGMDISQHGEEAYSDGEGAVLVFRDGPAPRPALAPVAAAGAA